jgi:hypothetical protein
MGVHRISGHTDGRVEHFAYQPRDFAVTETARMDAAIDHRKTIVSMPAD